MAYEKQEWKPRVGTGKNRFRKDKETEEYVYLTNEPESIAEPGTPFSAERMNHIEQGIFNAHVGLAEETGYREAAVQALEEGLKAEAEALEGRLAAKGAEVENSLNGKIEAANSVLAGVHAITLTGAFLTRVINGTTPAAKNLFDPDTVFAAGKTLINDENGTIGVYIRDIDSATIEIETKTVSPIAPNEPTLLGQVAYFSDLPLTVNGAVEAGWNTPRIDDYARVLNDETNNGQAVEWYISAIEDGNIAWSNPVILNTSDYQAQSTAADAGRVLTGGAAAGTFGQSLGIDSKPAEGSGNLITSGAVYNLFPVGSIFSTDYQNAENDLNGRLGGVWYKYPWGTDNRNRRQVQSSFTISKSGRVSSIVIWDGTEGPRTITIGYNANGETYSGATTFYLTSNKRGILKSYARTGQPSRRTFPPVTTLPEETLTVSTNRPQQSLAASDTLEADFTVPVSYEYLYSRYE
ncbi:MAG: hypothetical protein LBH44_07750 [Treponema sp.]|jgi:hypothetical protein|nr:hypothetical protein [Treponema sp.]